MVLQKKTENIIQIGHNFPDHPYKTLIIGGSESGKTNSLFNLISQPQILIKFIYTLKDQPKIKCCTGLMLFNDSNAFIET